MNKKPAIYSGLFHVHECLSIFNLTPVSFVLSKAANWWDQTCTTHGGCWVAPRKPITILFLSDAILGRFVYTQITLMFYPPNKDVTKISPKGCTEGAKSPFCY